MAVDGNSWITMTYEFNAVLVDVINTWKTHEYTWMIIENSWTFMAKAAWVVAPTSPTSTQGRTSP